MFRNWFSLVVVASLIILSVVLQFGFDVSGVENERQDHTHDLGLEKVLNRYDSDWNEVFAQFQSNFKNLHDTFFDLSQIFKCSNLKNQTKQ